LLFGVLGAEALARDLDEVGAVGQPVERGRGKQRLAEEFRPLGPIPVAGDSVDDRRFLIALVDDVVEILGPRRAQRLDG